MTKLQRLELRNTGVTDAGLVHFEGMKELGQLWLFGTKVTNAGAANLQKKLPKCRVVN